MTFYKKRRLLIERKSLIKTLEQECRNLTEELQKECAHEAIIESGYFHIVGTFPPRRMCVICGLEENGWGCGYQVLDDDSKIIKEFKGQNGRDEFYEYRDLKPLEELLPKNLVKLAKELDPAFIG